jgi:hypothetical protein
MAASNDNRVLSRKGARYLTDQEMQIVNGNGTFTTFSCTFDPRTGARDGDCD